MHIHQNENEHFLIAEGMAIVKYSTPSRYGRPAGTTVALTKNIRHAWGNPVTESPNV
jgi:mannose-6-phosphate isomerase-like protein (cupin superfamily)